MHGRLYFGQEGSFISIADILSDGNLQWKSALEVSIGSSHTSAWKLANDLACAFSHVQLL